MTAVVSSRARVLGSSAILLVSAVIPAPAVAQLRGVIDTSVRATAASNPIGTTSEHGKALSVGIQVDPSVYFEGGDATTATLKGSASIEQYTGDRGTASSLAVTGMVRHRIDIKTTVGLTASASSTRSAVQDFLRNPSLYGGGAAPTGSGPGGAVGGVGAGGVDVVDPFYPDLLEAYRGRVTSYRVGASISRELGRRDSLSFDAGVAWSQSGDPRGSDYRAETASLNYLRRLSERSSLTVSVGGGRADYGERNGLPGGHSAYVTPLLGISFRLSETVTTHASAGVSITRLDAPSVPSSTSVAFAGKFDICLRQYRGNLCATGSRQVQPTRYAGVTTVTSAGLNYSRMLGLRDRTALSAVFTRRGVSQDPRYQAAGSQTIFAVTGRYSHEINDRFVTFIDPSYSAISGGLNSGRHNVQVSVGIRYRLGTTSNE